MVDIRGYKFNNLKGIIGITGKAFSGKSTVSSIIADRLTLEGYSVIEMPFAYGLKKQCSEATGIPEEIFHDPTTKEHVRILMQWWGTEFRRNPALGGYEEYWLDQFVKLCYDKELDFRDFIGAGVDYIIAPDARFENEADVIRSQAVPGYFIHLEATGAKETYSPNHASEKRLTKRYNDWVLVNNQELGVEALKENVYTLMGRMGLL